MVKKRGQNNQNNNIDQIFDSFINQTIFRNKLILQTNYTPETIPHREKQITQVASIIAPSLRMEKPSNLFIYGLTGTGKTLVINYVKSELLKRASKQKIPLLIPYINCKLRKVADTEYRILAELLNKLGEKVPATGLPTDKLYHKFIELIDSKKQIIIIILDEIDQAVKKIGDDFLYSFTRLSSELNKAQISIIGISNDLKFIDVLDPRVKSSLSEEEILFPPYNALQLQDILKKRAKEAFKPKIVGEGVIEKCSAYAAREHGDARRALDLLRIAGEVVERDSKNKITLEYIDKAKERIESDKILMAVETQPKQFQITLLAILNLYKKLKDKNSPIFTGDIYNVYRDFCHKTKTECLTQRRISDIIAEFDMSGVINARVISKGRYGRCREIRIDHPSNLIEKINRLLMESLNL
ncbi:MAG: ORC1-type DNA replication protein [Candidatus Pacearchaeota archaeon]|nr:MAG: ORC1-type DNA replication protein [Candidatus Pacearchaeota archaeon]